MLIKEHQTTETFHKWLKESDDDTKLRFKVNWVIPHSLFNVACRFFESDAIQKVDFHKIYKSNDVGLWSREKKKHLKKDNN